MARSKKPTVDDVLMTIGSLPEQERDTLIRAIAVRSVHYQLLRNALNIAITGMRRLKKQLGRRRRKPENDERNRRILDESRSGLTDGQIAKKFNAEGKRTRDGKPYTRHTIATLRKKSLSAEQPGFFGVRRNGQPVFMVSLRGRKLSVPDLLEILLKVSGDIPSASKRDSQSEPIHNGKTRPALANVVVKVGRRWASYRVFLR